MSWASRRRTTYTIGVTVFLLVVFGIPAAYILYQPPNCHDGAQNQGETAIDKGGPCSILDERTLSPASRLWARAFRVRSGNYDAVAYVENPNKNAGVKYISYHFGLYDDRNVVVAERAGSMYIMPGGTTPVFEGNINTGNRNVAHTYFDFTQKPVWEKLTNSTTMLSIQNKHVDSTDTAPRLVANVTNTSVAPVVNAAFVAVVFDPAGNAFAASGTTLPRIEAGQTQQIVFTWPDPFASAVGKIDILPVRVPLPIPAAR